MKKSFLYTRTGDNGTTSLVGGKRVSKGCQRIEAYGTIDELNAFLGLLCAKLTNDDDKRFILSVQNKLFVLSGYLATPSEQEKATPCPFTEMQVEQMEKKIDRIDADLPTLKAFCIPGGSEASALAHVCRTVCRRAEREMLRLAEMESTDSQAIKYINRLSDYLFALSRKTLCDEQLNEIFYNNDCV